MQRLQIKIRVSLQSEYTQERMFLEEAKLLLSGKQFIKLSAVSALAEKSERATNARLASDYYLRKGGIHITLETRKSHKSLLMRWFFPMWNSNENTQKMIRKIPISSP